MKTIEKMFCCLLPIAFFSIFVEKEENCEVIGAKYWNRVTGQEKRNSWSTSIIRWIRNGLFSIELFSWWIHPSARYWYDEIVQRNADIKKKNKIFGNEISIQVTYRFSWMWKRTNIQKERKCTDWQSLSTYQ